MRKINCTCKKCKCEKITDSITTSEMIKMIEDQRLPFDEKKDGNKMIRSFDPSMEEHLFKWHFDEDDRYVEVLSGDGWRFQFDNEIPFGIEKGNMIFIPAHVYHRIIPGKNELRVLIEEFKVV